MHSVQYGGGIHGYQTEMSSSRSGNHQRPYSGQLPHHHQHQPADTFTADMRDRQARGKDPYQDSEESSDTTHWAGRRR